MMRLLILFNLASRKNPKGKYFQYEVDVTQFAKLPIFPY